ncbi:TetR/AcrR family transcriptional regulator [Nocardia sp. NPDC004068]|uniref:TetR/AcrR family transcriptional regulator n=1 Tax=Nocardia sp. NPDC004068 TaxID=3364303 RepID=UPI003692C845
MGDTGETRQAAWKQRAVERALRGAAQRAGRRVEQFLDAAQAIITEKGSTDFTVQEIVDRSGQSLRSFYLQFDGKHQLLLALYEEAVGKTAAQIRAAATVREDPVDALRTAVELLFHLCRPDPDAHRPLFTEFSPRLRTCDPAEVRAAHAALFALFAELMERVGAAGRLRPGANPRRLAATTMQAVMFIAHPGTVEADPHPISAAEAWAFCAHGIVGAGEY